MARAKLSGSLLAARGTTPSRPLAQGVSPPSDLALDRSFAHLFENGPSAGHAPHNINNAGLPRPGARAAPTTGKNLRLVWIVSVGLAICGIAAVFFLLVQPTRQAGPTAALHWNPAFGSVSDAARASTELTAQLSTTIASYDDSSSQVAPIPPASPGAAAPTATPVAAMAPRETAGAPPAVASPPQHRTESQAGASTAAIGSEPTAATVEVGPPKKPVTVDAPLHRSASAGTAGNCRDASRRRSIGTAARVRPPLDG